MDEPPELGVCPYADARVDDDGPNDGDDDCPALLDDEFDAPVAKPPSNKRPCVHNQWQKVGKKRSFTILRCLVCREAWRADLTSFAKCNDFYAGRCNDGPSCPKPHIYSLSLRRIPRRLRGDAGSKATGSSGSSSCISMEQSQVALSIGDGASCNSPRTMLIQSQSSTARRSKERAERAESSRTKMAKARSSAAAGPAAEKESQSSRRSTRPPACVAGPAAASDVSDARSGDGGGSTSQSSPNSSDGKDLGQNNNSSSDPQQSSSSGPGSGGTSNSRSGGDTSTGTGSNGQSSYGPPSSNDAGPSQSDRGCMPTAAAMQRALAPASAHVSEATSPTPPILPLPMGAAAAAQPQSLPLPMGAVAAGRMPMNADTMSPPVTPPWPAQQDSPMPHPQPQPQPQAHVPLVSPLPQMAQQVAAQPQQCGQAVPVQMQAHQPAPNMVQVPVSCQITPAVAGATTSPLVARQHVAVNLQALMAGQPQAGIYQAQPQVPGQTWFVGAAPVTVAMPPPQHAGQPFAMQPQVAVPPAAQASAALPPQGRLSTNGFIGQVPVPLTMATLQAPQLPPPAAMAAEPADASPAQVAW